jgi:hypothetical protein
MSGSQNTHRMDTSTLPDSGIQQQNEWGQWLPAIPEPLYVGWGLRHCRCECGEVRKTRLSYQEHYALAHVMGMGVTA